MPYKPSPREQVIHDEVTQTIIVGIICEELGDGLILPSVPIKAAERIMSLLQRRGYKPHIRSFNQLSDGKAC